ncbi:hypothetical protein BH10PSE12_BH10PSE12_10830 [soil metagenome]
MPRILLILLLFVLLIPGKHSQKDKAAVAGALLVSAQALPLGSTSPPPRSIGPLQWRGSWAIKSRQADFGGLSSMIVTADGSILGLSDSGTLMGFRVDSRAAGRQFMAPLPVRPAQRDWPNWKWDSESMVHDPASGRYWVGFELIQWICRYSPGFARVESCATWPEMQAWPPTGGAEAMVRLADGRFIVFGEMAEGAAGGNDALLFDGDPADPATARPHHMTYRAPQGYRPTDAVVIGGNRLLVLNRRATLHEGFTGSIDLVDLPPLRAGALLIGREIAHLAPPLLADNYEALALSREGDDTILWVASDDNHLFFQRTLLLKFALPRSWAPDRPPL